MLRGVGMGGTLISQLRPSVVDQSKQTDRRAVLFFDNEPSAQKKMTSTRDYANEIKERYQKRTHGPGARACIAMTSQSMSPSHARVSDCPFFTERRE